MNPNATTIDRLMHYVESEQYEQAEALAKLCDYLEECYLCDVTFEEYVSTITQCHPAHRSSPVKALCVPTWWLNS